MKIARVASGAWVCGLLVLRASGDPLAITSFQGNGTIVWTNSIQTSGWYRVEWADAPNGPWRASLAATGGSRFLNVQAGDSTSFSAQVPMFYRIALVTNAPPHGHVLVPGGSFTMGNAMDAAEGGASELPRNAVALDAFWMKASEVTVEEWHDVVDWATNRTPVYAFSSVVAEDPGGHPVTRVTWEDAVKWCNAHSEKEGLSPVYGSMVNIAAPPQVHLVWRTARTNVEVNLSARTANNGYRLPTEAEWEYAARGGVANRRFPGGDTLSHHQAAYQSWQPALVYDLSRDGASEFHPLYGLGTAPCGMFSDNGHGLFDMAANAKEWCWDYYGAYVFAPEGLVNPTGPTSGSARVFRGGCNSDTAYYLRVSARESMPQANTTVGVGFRTVLRAD